MSARYDNVLALILGGGRGTRLYPLTKERCKPAISFGGKYRLIDIPVSNCLHSHINKIYILTQFLTASIHRHIFQTYRMDNLSNGFVDVLAAEQTQTSEQWYQGTADAVRRSIRHFKDLPVDDVLILSGDQLCAMDYMPMIDFHRTRNAGMTIIGKTVARDEISRMGIIKVTGSGKIETLIEKPRDSAQVADCADGTGAFIASTGNYIFKKSFLLSVLLDNEDADFGKQIIPRAIQKGNVYLYPFTGYWEDIGTIRAFFWANLALVAPQAPIDLYDEKHTFFTHPRFLPAAKLQDSVIHRSLISEGGLIEKATIEDSVVGIRSVIKEGATIKRSVLMGNDYYERSLASGSSVPCIGRGVTIEGAIIDKNVVIGDGVRIEGLRDETINSDNPLYCIRDGIVIVSKGTVIPPHTVIR